MNSEPAGLQRKLFISPKFCFFFLPFIVFYDQNEITKTCTNNIEITLNLLS